jgi:hypothetical protein
LYTEYSNFYSSALYSVSLFYPDNVFKLKIISRPAIHSEGYDITNKVIQFFNQGKSSGNLKFKITNATKCAAAATGKS